jgi:cytochrome d ubiquinol oxidase subunit I
VPPQDRPPVWSVFYAFRIMLAVGFTMIGAGLFGVWLWWRGRLFTTRWYLKAASWSWWIGFVAVISGWLVTESGRQPWVAYGILRTADAVSPVLASNIAQTLALFVIVYGIVFGAGIYYINRLIEHGPVGAAVAEPERKAGPPIGAADAAGREIM